MTPIFSEFDLNKSEYLAFTEGISRYTVGVRTDGGRGIGTGTVLLRDRKKVLLTADHVLDGVDMAQVRFYLRPEGTMIEVSVRDDVVPRPRTFTFGDTLNLTGPPARDKKNDLRTLRIADTQELSGAAKFYDASKLTEYEIRDGASVVILGFPVSNSAPLAPGLIALGATSDHSKYDSKLNSLSGLPSAFDPLEQFLINYTRIEDNLDPEGFSGAGVWVNGDTAGGVWRPNPVLAGVVTGYFAKKRLLLAARIGPVLRLLDRL
jgi:hypothetical protein